MTKRSKAVTRIPRRDYTKVTLSPSPWDHGADGPANREGLIDQEATGEIEETTLQQPPPRAAAARWG